MNRRHSLAFAQVVRLFIQLLRFHGPHGYVCAFRIPRLPSLEPMQYRLASQTVHYENVVDVGETSGPLALGLYVHIPYCRQRCRYCDFAIVPIGKYADTESNGQLTEIATSGFRALDRNYADTVLQEIAMQARITQKITSTSNKVALKSIYFGGGTPSLAPADTLRRILHAILEDDGPFSVDLDTCEITIEADPGTFSLDKLRAFRDLGFNRLSLGVQSFDDDVLEPLGRVHRCQDIMEAIDMIQTVYGDKANYSIDLISGLPGVSMAAWVETLQTALTLEPRPNHVSIYDLQIEQGTAFGRWYDKQGDDDDDNDVTNSNLQSTKGDPPVSTGLRKLPSARDSAFMYTYAAGYLRAKGYEHYEVSSYARKSTHDSGELTSYRSQHNQIYWALDGQWLAVGLGATSFVNGHTVARPRRLVDYERWVTESVSLNDTIEDDNAGRPYDVDFLMDTVLKRLRTSEGLSITWIRKHFGDNYGDAVLRGAQLGIDLSLAFFDSQTNMLRLSDPDGFLFSNSIISSVFVELERMSSRMGVE